MFFGETIRINICQKNILKMTVFAVWQKKEEEKEPLKLDWIGSSPEQKNISSFNSLLNSLAVELCFRRNNYNKTLI